MGLFTTPGDPIYRSETIERLKRGSFDILIIGGGIAGAGIARDAALRGLRVAMVEKGDFAQGASSKTSKLIHGGLRYLEHGHLGLVRNSLQERSILRGSAPGIVRPLPIFLPVYRGDARSSWKIRAGLFLYHQLAGKSALSARRILRAAEAPQASPFLKTDNLTLLGQYQDCLMDDSRLCLVNVLQASAGGAVCANQVQLKSLLFQKGRVCGGSVEDLVSGSVFEVHAEAVINAAGPWGDQVRRMSDSNAPARLAPTKGIHLVLPSALKHGLFIQARSDSRMLFLLPWMGQTLVGTTETSVQGPLESLRAESEEAAYLLSEVRRVLPEPGWTEKDVVGSFAGARPLLGYSGRVGAATREHKIEEDRNGLFSILGGKYTTYRKMAQDTVNTVVQRRRFRAESCTTQSAPLVPEYDFDRPVASGLAPEVLGRLAIRYGASAGQVLALLEREPELGAAACPHHPYLLAELVHALRCEAALTVSDLFIRRTPMLYSACRGLDGEASVRLVLKRYLMLPEETISAQWEAYREKVKEGEAFRSG